MRNGRRFSQAKRKVNFSDFHPFDRVKTGRVGRRVLWCTALADVVILLAAFFAPLEIVYRLQVDPQGVFMRGWLLSFAVLFVTITMCFTRLTKRRLHDAGFSGWHILWILIPVAGWLGLIWLLMKPSVEEKTPWDAI